MIKEQNPLRLLLGLGAIFLLLVSACENKREENITTDLEKLSTIEASGISNPLNTYLNSTPEALSNSKSANFEFSCNRSTCSFQCKLDRKKWKRCRSPKVYNNLADRTHIFQVRAKDSRGRTDSTPAKYHWTIDSIAPETTLRSHPPDPVNQAFLRFEFSSNDPQAVFECQLDGLGFGACKSPKYYIKLPDGAHTFEVRAKDSAGNLDPTPESYTWTVDRTPPDTIITSQPPHSTTSDSADFSFDCTGGPCAFECKLDFNIWYACDSPQSFSGLAEGGHSFQVRARDQVGNLEPSPANYVWWRILSVQLSAGINHNCIRKTDQTIWCWGLNNYGQLGDGTTAVHKITPVQAGSDADWALVSAGGSHSCALKNDGTLWCWGADVNGQLGDGATANKNTPNQVGADTNWVSVSAGWYHTCATKIDGTLWCWGYNFFGQLGLGTSGQDTDRNVPTKVGGYPSWVSSLAGWYHSCAIKTDGTLWCWGRNDYGKLGNGSYLKTDNPVQAGTDADWEKVDAGNWHNCAIKIDGTLWCWGGNSSCQLGTGNTDGHTTPFQIGTDQDWDKITAGGFHSCGIKTNGTLWCWGNNDYGQLGNGTWGREKVPIQVGSASWNSVSAGQQHTCGIQSNGSLWCAGRNSVGQLGIGDIGDRPNFTQVGSDNNWSGISAGANHNCARKTNGTLWCWGTGYNGELGNGDNYPALSAVQVGADTNWSGIGLGLSHGCALKTDGTLFCWGKNDYGQLGDGTNLNKNVPTQVGTGSDWAKIAGGHGHSCGIKAGGTLWCWGINADGQLGDGTAWKEIPQQVILP